MQCVEKVFTPTPDPTTRIPNSSVLLSVTKNPNGGISETKRAIRDPLVSKQAENILIMKKQISQNISKRQNI